jgi:hypothetical protein
MPLFRNLEYFEGTLDTIQGTFYSIQGTLDTYASFQEPGVL